MWPFDQLRARRHARRYRSALIVLLGHYFYERLPIDERKRVDEAVSENLRGDIYWFPVNFWQSAGWAGIAMERALAMARLGIEPTAHGLSWRELLRRIPREYFGQRDALEMDYWPEKPRPWDSRVGFVAEDFWPSDPATGEAKSFLRAHGLEVAEVDPRDVIREVV